MAIAIVLAIGVLAPAGSAMACGVCYGDADSPMTEGMNNGILFLLGIIGVVQVGFVALFWNFRKRARQIQARKESFRLIEGGR
ncbi:MAG TPA: hypothetical protein VMS56_08845 [Thermoanaerobaculia bacterium]|nr:hypothetical protein [Thermoanaerobaculia bacterium]